MLYQLQIQPPNDDRPRPTHVLGEASEFWTHVRGGELMCDGTGADGTPLVTPSGQPRNVILSRGYLDFLLLTPRGWAGRGRETVLRNLRRAERSSSCRSACCSAWSFSMWLVASDHQ